MKFNEMTNVDLHEHAKTLARREREVTIEMILALREVWRRRLCLLKGYQSTIDYAVRGLGLSEDQARVRVRIARVSEFHPQVIEKLRDGTASMTHLAVAANKITEANAETVFAAMQGTSKREFMAKLATIMPDGQIVESAKAPTTRLVFECDNELTDAYERLRGLMMLSGRLDEASPEAMLRAIVEMGLERVDPVRAAKRAEVRKEKKMEREESKGAEAETAARAQEASPGPAVPEPDLSPTRVRYIPADVRHEVMLRDGSRCQYVADDAIQCGATVGLQFDHYPKLHCHGAANTARELQMVCAAHNLLRARQSLGAGFMASKIGERGSVT